MSCCSFISEEKPSKNRPTAPTRCERPNLIYFTELIIAIFNHSKTNLSSFFAFCSPRHGLIKGCCQWKDQDRPTVAELRKKLVLGEKNASDKVIKVSETVNIEQYLQEAGYGENNSYTVF